MLLWLSAETKTAAMPPGASTAEDGTWNNPKL
jgi:hypothetical protein